MPLEVRGDGGGCTVRVTMPGPTLADGLAVPTGRPAFVRSASPTRG